jgi:hypothetical protein
MFVAVLDFKNLDNPLFLKSFAESLTKFPKSNSIILHGDSEYTNRIIQTGVMRNEAIVRSTKDINHRIVTFLADFGIACIGINGFQRDMILLKDNEIQINQSLLDKIPPNTIVVLSNLIKEKSGQLRACSLSELSKKIARDRKINDIFVFSTSDSDPIFTKNDTQEAEIIHFSKFSQKKNFEYLPAEIKSISINFKFCKPFYNNKINSFDIIQTVITDDSIVP